MKRFLTIASVAALTICLAACSNKEEDTKTTSLGFALTNENIEVEDLTEDYTVIVSNTDYTIDIEIAYADKDELSALKVNIINLPDGAEADPASSSYDYTDGNTQSIAISNNGYTQAFVISASCSAAEPHFISATLNGTAASNGTARLSGTTDLTAVTFEYEVSPSETTVSLAGEEIESGSTVDFSDKINGVTFTLTCDGVSATETITVVTTGIGSVERVWGHYVAPVNTTDDWFGTSVAASGWERTCTMDDNYVYMAKAKSGDDKGCYAIDITDPSQVKELSMTGINAEGTFHTSDAVVVNDGTSTRLLLCNMANAADSHLYVYSYTSVDDDPTTVLDYTLPEAYRFGDKFTVWGDWSEGSLNFYDYAGNEILASFAISGGTINSTPTLYTLNYGTAKDGGIGAMYKYSDTEYMWAGAGTYPHIYSYADGTFTETVNLEEYGFPNPTHAPIFFDFNNQSYMAYIQLENSYCDATLRIIELNYDTLTESLENNTMTTVCYKYGLGDPDEVITGNSNGNGLGDACLREINGETYIVAMAPSTGVSLFKLNK